MSVFTFPDAYYEKGDSLVVESDDEENFDINLNAFDVDQQELKQELKKSGSEKA